MKHENKCKRKGKKVLPALEDKNLAKILIAISIGQETGLIDQNLGKTNFFEKQRNFVQKLFKA